LIVVDNGSVDKTVEILNQLQREIPKLVVRHDDKFGHTHQRRVNGLLQAALTAYQPTFAVPLDADEFLGVPSRDVLRAALDVIPNEGYGVMPWRTFVLTPQTLVACEANPPQSFRYRRREEVPLYSKVILRTNGATSTDMELDFGSHNISSTTGRQVPGVNLPLHLMHFPVRSRNQFVPRIVVGWMANLTRDPNARTSDAGWQKRDNFDRIARGESFDPKALCEVSMLYAQHARPIEWQADVVEEMPEVWCERRYSDGRAMDAIQLIARAWEQSLQGTDSDNGVTDWGVDRDGERREIDPTGNLQSSLS
jgi:hypothetical protein